MSGNMELLTLNVKVNVKNYYDCIDERLKEAEEQMGNTTKRYSKKELLEQLDDIISEYEKGN